MEISAKLVSKMQSIMRKMESQLESEKSCQREEGGEEK